MTVLPVTYENTPSLAQSLLMHAGPVVACVEVCRRMMWGWLRVEYEHMEVFGVALPTTTTEEENNTSNISNNSGRSGNDEEGIHKGSIRVCIGADEKMSNLKAMSKVISVCGQMDE